MRIAFMGFGEAAEAIVSGWDKNRRAEIKVFDVKSLNPGTRSEIEVRAGRLSVENSHSLKEVLQDADLIFSTVTADQAVEATKEGARFIKAGVHWCDLNSCAPGSKNKSASIIGKRDGKYTDVAVMSPVYPKRNMVPLLISGAYAGEVLPVLTDLPMNARVVGSKVGRASSIKMIRSIMVKGMEALTAECVLAAVAAGVEDEVVPSLKRGHPFLDLATRAAYNFERSIVHGERRAAEMEEVAKTLTELNLPNQMSLASAKWQALIAKTETSPPHKNEDENIDYQSFARLLLPLIRQK